MVRHLWTYMMERVMRNAGDNNSTTPTRGSSASPFSPATTYLRSLQNLWGGSVGSVGWFIVVCATMDHHTMIHRFWRCETSAQGTKKIVQVISCLGHFLTCGHESCQSSHSSNIKRYNWLSFPLEVVELALNIGILHLAMLVSG